MKFWNPFAKIDDDFRQLLHFAEKFDFLKIDVKDVPVKVSFFDDWRSFVGSFWHKLSKGV